ncbi:MAG: hypothetical protein FWF55_05030 [Treponema sp.]|nr:hypothetical protein [Treponema sp.]
METDTAKARENAQRAREAAEKFFPGEKWVKVEDGIYLSPRRPIGKKSNYPDELRDAQILRDGGSTVYLAPEVRSDKKKKFDAIVDGLQMEFKNMRGISVRTLKSHFLDSRKQAPHVFINLEDSPLSKHKIIRFLISARNSPEYDEKNRFPEGGSIILKIKGHRNLIYQEVNDIKS